MITGEMPYAKPRMALYMRPSIPKRTSTGKNYNNSIVVKRKMFPNNFEAIVYLHSHVFAFFGTTIAELSSC